MDFQLFRCSSFLLCTSFMMLQSFYYLDCLSLKLCELLSHNCINTPVLHYKMVSALNPKPQTLPKTIVASDHLDFCPSPTRVATRKRTLKDSNVVPYPLFSLYPQTLHESHFLADQALGFAAYKCGCEPKSTRARKLLHILTLAFWIETASKCYGPSKVTKPSKVIKRWILRISCKQGSPSKSYVVTWEIK